MKYDDKKKPLTYFTDEVARARLPGPFFGEASVCLLCMLLVKISAILTFLISSGFCCESSCGSVSGAGFIS